MTSIVLDCSVAISWCFEDEATQATDKILDMVSEDGAYVPSLWHLEVTNTLIQACKRGRIDNHAILHRLNDLSALPIKTDLETHNRAFTDIISLAKDQVLTTYDAAYLELASRRKLPLATKDKALKKAAKRLGVSVVF